MRVHGGTDPLVAQAAPRRRVPAEREQVLALARAELQSLRQGGEHLLGRHRTALLLDPAVVVGRHAGQHRDLLAPQPAGAAPGAAGKPDVLRLQRLAAGPEKVRQQCPVHRSGRPFSRCGCGRRGAWPTAVEWRACGRGPGRESAPRAARSSPVIGSNSSCRTRSTCPGSTWAIRSRPASVTRHDDAALVIRRRRAGDQAALVQQPRLVGEPAAAVHDAVGQIGHPQPALGRVHQAGQDLELHVAQVTVGAQMLVHRVLEQAADLHQGEVRAELLRVQAGRRVAHPAILLAWNSKGVGDGRRPAGRDRLQVAEGHRPAAEEHGAGGRPSGSR